MSTAELENEIRHEFLEEATEIAEEVENLLLKIEKDYTNIAHHDHIFRLVHTLKGSAFAANFDDLAQFAHLFETLLTHIRSQKISLDDEVAQILLASNDKIKEFVELLQSDQECVVGEIEQRIIVLLESKGFPVERQGKISAGLQLFEDDDKSQNVNEKTQSKSESIGMESVAFSASTRSRINEKATVLICDDDEAVLDVLETLVKEEEYQVLLASNGKEAIEILAKSKVDVVISDLKMPEMDGIEFLTQVRDQGNEIPVIMISGHASRDDLAQFIHMGAHDFIDKPFNSDLIFLSIKNALRLKLTRDGVINLASTSFKAYMAMTKLFTRRNLSEDDRAQLEESVKVKFDEIATLTNTILGF